MNEDLPDAPFISAGVPTPPPATPAPAGAPTLPDAPFAGGAATPTAPRAATGALESIQAGLQGSVGGLFWRRKLPDLVTDPANSAWWERALTGLSAVGADLPLMVVGGAAGAAFGGGFGGGVAGPPGAAAGGVLGMGAGMFGVPAAMRETLIQSYKSGENTTVGGFFTALSEVAKATLKEAGIGMATTGAGALAARTVGTAIAPAIGPTIGVGTATKAIGTTDVAAQIAAMVTVPAALEGRMPHLQDFVDAAIVIAGLKTAHVGTERLMDIYAKTGKTPAEVVADIKENPTIAEDLVTDIRPAPMTPKGPEIDLEARQASLLEERAAVPPAPEGEPSAPLVRAIDLATDRPWDYQQARESLMWALDNRRMDIAETIVARANRLATEAEGARAEPEATRAAGEPPALPADGADQARREAASLNALLTVSQKPLPIEESPVYTKILEQLQGLERFSDEQAKAYAAMTAAFFKTKAERTGKSVEQLFEEYGPSFTTKPPSDRTLDSGSMKQKKSPDLGIQHPEVRATLQRMIDHDEIGWAEIGGRLDIARLVKEFGPDAIDENGRPTKLGVVAFTSWVPKADWWTGRPGHPGKGLNDKGVRAAIEKALRGEKLKALEQRTIDYLVGVAEDRIAAYTEIGPERFADIAAIAAEHDLEPTTKNIIDADAVARAQEKDEAAFERAVMEHQDDDAAFMAAIRRINGEEEAAGAAGEKAGAGGQEGERSAGPGRHPAADAIRDSGSLDDIADGVPGADPNSLYQSRRPETWWYSELARQVDTAKMKQAPAQGWKDWLKSLPQKGVKADEIRWSGLEEWLDLQEGRVTKEQVADFLKSGGVKIDEIMLGSPNEKGLRDAAIAADVADLERRGWTVEQDPDNERYYAFADPEGNVEDIADLRRYAAEGDRSVADALPAIERIHGYMTNGTGFTTAPEGWGTIIAEVARPSKFSQYQLPGGKNYRELLLTLPNKPLPTELPPGYVVTVDRRFDYLEYRVEGPNAHVGASGRTEAAAIENFYRSAPPGGEVARGPEFQSSHFHEPNILAHVRFNERTDADGKRVLFVEEFQSDWAQKGRKEGFSDDFKAAEAERARIREEYETASEVSQQSWSEARDAIRQYLTGQAARRANGADDIISRIYEATDAGATRADWMRQFRITSESDAEIIEKAIEDQGRVDRLRTALEQATPNQRSSEIPRAPFVEKTEAWTALALKRMIRYAAEHGFDRIAWTRGEQQVERYTAALRKAVDAIDWEKTPEGIHLIGYKGREKPIPPGVTIEDMLREQGASWSHTNDLPASEMPPEGWPGPWRLKFRDGSSVYYQNMGDIKAAITREYRITHNLDGGREIKVVDTTEKETALSDAIGKAMAERIINDPAQKGSIDGENIKIDDTGMAGYYDRLLPSIAKDVIKKLGGGKITTTQIELPKYTQFGQAEGPRVVQGREAPVMRELTDTTGLEGAEPFPNGDVPLHGEAKIDIDGRTYDVLVVLDANGLNVISPEPEFTLAAQYSRRMDTAEQARDWLLRSWGNPPLWSRVEVINGEIPVGKSDSTHQAIDITPQMAAKAMDGLPLFQRLGPSSARGYYTPDERKIGFLENADASTFIHESGHFYLDVSADLARAPEATPQLKADMQTVFDWLGVKDADAWDAMSLDEKRPFHERWAQGFEQYIAEGKAPSTALAGAFQRFKEWLLQVYRTLTRLNVGLTPEVRRVMDRMLATDEEIAQGTPRAYAQDAVDQRSKQMVPGEKAVEVSLKPFADELPQLPGEPAKPTHVNYNRINTAEDTKLAMARVSEIYEEEIQTQRRGKVSWEETSREAGEQMAALLGGDPSNVVATREPGTPAAAAELLARKQMTVGAAEAMMAARDHLLERGPEATNEDKLAFLASIERLSMIQAEFLGARAEAGRALNILKMTKLDADRARQIQDVIRLYGDNPVELARMMGEIESHKGAVKFAKDVTNLTAGAGKLIDEVQAVLQANAGDPVELQRQLEILQTKKVVRTDPEVVRLGVAEVRKIIDRNRKDPAKLAEIMKEISTPEGAKKFAEEAMRPTWWDKIVEAWKAGILSGWVTHAANILGNGMFMGLRPAIDAAAVVVGRARLASPQERLAATEPLARLYGNLQGTADGLRYAWHVLRTGGEESKSEQYRPAIEGVKGEIIRIPFRMLASADALFRTMNERGEAYTLAARKLAIDDVSPATREYLEKMQAIVDNPTEAMAEQIQAAGKRFTFNTELGEKGKAVQNLVKTWHLEWIVPFIRTPANVAQELIRMTPGAPLIGEWSNAMRRGGADRDKAVAELLVGTAIMSLVAAYAFDGAVSGQGEPDTGKKRINRAAGWQPYSVKIGDTWYSYNRLQPLGTLLGLAADMAEIWDHANEEESDKIPKMIGVAFANAITNQTFLQGITNLVMAISEPDRRMAKLGQQLAGSLVPNILGQSAQAKDPLARRIDSMLDAIRSRIPGEREKLLPKIDVWGEPEKGTDRVAGMLPVNESKESEDKVRTEAERLGLSAPGAPKKGHIGRGTGKAGDIKLEPEQQNIFATAAGKQAYAILVPIVNSPGWDELPPLIKKRAYAKAFLMGSRAGAYAALPPELRNSMMGEISQRIMTELEPEAAQ